MHILLMLTPALGWGVYLLLMRKWTGNAFEGFVAQKQFGMQSIGNLVDVKEFVWNLFTPGNFHEVFGSTLDRVFFLLLIYFLPIVWQLDFHWVLWSLLLGVVPAMSGMFVSYIRFQATVFPLFVAMAVFFAKPGLLFRILRVLVITAFFGLQAILVWRFVNYRWAG